MINVAKFGLAMIVTALMLVALAATGRGQESKPPSLVGTWKAASSTKEVTHLKHVTPTHYTILRITEGGEVSRVLGGTYTIKDGIYEEKTLYGTAGQFEHLRDGVHEFSCKREGKMWHHGGKLANGNPIDEVWERIE